MGSGSNAQNLIQRPDSLGTSNAMSLSPQNIGDQNIMNQFAQGKMSLNDALNGQAKDHTPESVAQMTADIEKANPQTHGTGLFSGMTGGTSPADAAKQAQQAYNSAGNMQA